MEKYNLDKNKIKLHNIVIATTTTIDYEMERWYLLEDLEDLSYNEYVILEGGHCSCYDFDDTRWEAMKYKKEELLKIAKDRIDKSSYYKEEKRFYKLVFSYLGGENE